MLNYHEIGDLIGRVAKVKVLDAKWVQAYSTVATLESGANYVVGAPQGLTRLLLAESGAYPVSKLLLTRKDLRDAGESVVMREFIDYSALAPLNLSLGRLKTFNDLPPRHRGSIRFRLLQMVEPSQHADFTNVLGRLQFAALSVSPVAVGDRDAHSKYWVNWSATARALKSADSWEPMTVCVVTTDGVEHKGWI